MKNQIINNGKTGIAGFQAMVLLVLFLMGSSVTKAQHHESKAEELFDIMKLQKGSWVADVGSREGRYSVAMSTIVGDEGHVFAVDIDEDAFDGLQENIVDEGASNVTPVFSIPGNPMLPDHSLDVVLVRSTYHEFTQYMSMLRQIRQSLKPDGRLIIADPITENLVGASRSKQTDHHKLESKFVRDELIGAGFSIKKVDKKFSENDHHRHWLIVATPGK